MSDGLRIGRVSNIQVSLDWSWVLLVLFVLPALLVHIRVTAFPTGGWGMAFVLSAAVLACALGSVLVRQLAQALVAGLDGVTVERMLLYPFGGVQDVQLDPIAPETEAKIALAGPIASAVVGSLLLVVLATLNGSTAFLFPDLVSADPLQYLLWWTAVLNLVLVLVNLLPGVPLDGGHIVRAFFWERGSDPQWARRTTRQIGIAAGWVILIATVPLLLFADLAWDERILFGSVTAITGWAIKTAAHLYPPVLPENPLRGVRVREFTLSPVPEISFNLTLAQLVHKYIFGTTNRLFAVMRGDLLEGMLPVEDVWKVPEEQWKRVLVKHIMTPREQLVVVKPDDSAEFILEVLSRLENRPVPVVDKGRMLGVLRRRKVQEWIRSNRDKPGWVPGFARRLRGDPVHKP